MCIMYKDFHVDEGSERKLFDDESSITYVINKYQYYLLCNDD